MADTIRPTPTQNESDRAALGEHVLTKQDDGSGPPTTVWPPATEEPSPPPENGDGENGEGEQPTEPVPIPPLEVLGEAGARATAYVASAARSATPPTRLTADVAATASGLVTPA
jgi:hypothetical protein